MSLVRQIIDNLLNGISQRPPQQRRPSQATEQLNALSSITRGVMKRPGSRYVAKLSDDDEEWESAFLHGINRDSDERYVVAIVDGDVRVFNRDTGEEIPVEAPNGKDYLNDELGKGFRASTVGDTTVIVNRGIKTQSGTATAPEQLNEALVFVQQADFSTIYKLTLSSPLGDQSILFQTVDQDTPEARRGINTEKIAEDILALMGSNVVLVAFYTMTRYGATIHIKRRDIANADFELSVSDGLGDNGLKAVKGSVQAFEDLPARAQHGFIAQITGSLETAKDDYYVQYDDLGSPGKPGLWRECPKPGTLIEFDETTMPHQLVLRGEIPLADHIHEFPVSPILDSVLDGTFLGYDTWDTLTEAGYYPDAVIPFYQCFRYGAGGAWTADTDYDVVEIDTKLSLFTGPWPAGEKAQIIILLNGSIYSKQEYDLTSGVPIEQTHRLTGVLTGDIIECRLAYASGSTPAGNVRASLIFSRLKRFSQSGLIVTVAESVQLHTGSELEELPPGSSVQLLLADGTLPIPSFVVTTNGTTIVTMEDIADELTALVDADPDYTATNIGRVITIVRTDGNYPGVGSLMEYPANTFVNTKLSLTDDEMVDRILTNTTDGSSGTVTTNGGFWITVDALTGGFSNQFNQGDVVSAFVDPEIGTHFVFSPIQWDKRGAGSLETVPFPSFLTREIADVFFYQNRIGFLCKENLIFSASGDLFNFFRNTATDLRADDMIDVRSAHSEVTIFDTAFMWEGGLYCKSDNVWFSVTGQPALQPSTIRLDIVGRYPSSKDPRPAVVGDKVFFTRSEDGVTKVYEVTRTTDGITGSQKTISQEITREVPRYLLGTPVAIYGDAGNNLLFVVTRDADGLQDRVYVYAWLDNESERVISSWSHWDLGDAQIMALDVIDGKVGLVVRAGDNIQLELMSLSQVEQDENPFSHLDRRFDPAVLAVPEEADPWIELDGDNTILRSPYGWGQNISVIVQETGEELDWVDDGDERTLEGDYTETPLWVGELYQWRYIPTTLFFRDTDGRPDTAGRLGLKWLNSFLINTTSMDIKTQLPGRPLHTRRIRNEEPMDLTARVPIAGRNTDVSLVFEDLSPGPCALYSMEWEGDFNLRSRRT